MVINDCGATYNFTSKKVVHELQLLILNTKVRWGFGLGLGFRFEDRGL